MENLQFLDLIAKIHFFGGGGWGFLVSTQWVFFSSFLEEMEKPFSIQLNPMEEKVHNNRDVRKKGYSFTRDHSTENEQVKIDC